jgi:hypothetical protein
MHLSASPFYAQSQDLLKAMKSWLQRQHEAKLHMKMHRRLTNRSPLLVAFVDSRCAFSFIGRLSTKLPSHTLPPSCILSLLPRLGKDILIWARTCPPSRRPQETHHLEGNAKMSRQSLIYSLGSRTLGRGKGALRHG